MRRRWYYFKRMLQADRLFAAQMIGQIVLFLQRAGLWISVAAVCAAVLYSGRVKVGDWLQKFYETYAVQIADDLMRGFLPAWKEDEGAALLFGSRKRNSGSQTETYTEIFGIESENEALRSEWIAESGERSGVGLNQDSPNSQKTNGEENAEEKSNSKNGVAEENTSNYEGKSQITDMNGESRQENGAPGKNENTETNHTQTENVNTGNNTENNIENDIKNETSPDENPTLTALLASTTFNPANSGIILEKLGDYDYLMKKFYNVHPTTTADRGIMQAEEFLTADLSIEKDAAIPQILIYHTHSQEKYADYPGDPDADVVHLGEYLTELLREKGYNVIHDESVYDYRNGKLDRSAAYTYALDGITGILQKYPSIEVVLDVHRDGVADGTRLVTEIDGIQTAKIMFFNGTSMSPDGPIEYLPNPNLSKNLAFSFQMQLLAAGKYPGLTRKIYLKGLRYNEHVRARSALIEVGAQTNTYAEAKAAMVPLADLLDQVLNHG